MLPSWPPHVADRRHDGLSVSGAAAPSGSGAEHLLSVDIAPRRAEKEPEIMSAMLCRNDMRILSCSSSTCGLWLARFLEAVRLSSLSAVTPRRQLARAMADEG
eukprot:3139102-Prymnesium_polylepis.1